ncbi:2-keto-3-deoxygluconate permease [Vagococcus carniphilus]|uniref:2-keto-3-deoxygluconate permease n=1 Tax=Vagococcus carniphilus TaxID=218144 RepID=A0A430AMV0_9ENTE|nr:2-keto-3-deoxygluconate permease [Vagococcus carniphilus]QNN72656.1 2-keto-3-deoxygluconate permease [Vagococcus carniphilus]RSU09419.1 2-keto-3-deoxygluconate permease [Vagococcus carniphilus]
MKFLKKVPGGFIIVPLLTAILVNTFFPSLLEIGGPATALFKNGNAAMMGLFLIVCGSAINFKEAGLPLYKGSVLLLLKFIVGAGVGYIVGNIFGPAGVLGLTPFVLISTLTSSNSSLYIAMSSEYGNASDTGAISIFSIKDGPFITMVAMGMTGLADIPWQQIVAMIIPLLLGAIWGNLDSEFKDLCSKAQPLVIIFMSFAIGANTSIGTILQAGFSGVLLGIISLVIGILYFFLYNLFLKKKTALGVLLGTVAANSALTPGIVAEADPSLQPYVEMATAQAATASIITLLIAPVMLTYFDKFVKKKYGPERLNEQPNLKQ